MQIENFIAFTTEIQIEIITEELRMLFRNDFDTGAVSRRINIENINMQTLTLRQIQAIHANR